MLRVAQNNDSGLKLWLCSLFVYGTPSVPMETTTLYLWKQAQWYKLWNQKEEVSKLKLLILRRTCQNGILPVTKICSNPVGDCHKSLFQSRICWRIPGTQTSSSAGGVSTVCVGWAHSLTSGAAANSSHQQSLGSSAHKNILQRVGVFLRYTKNTQNYWVVFFLYFTCSAEFFMPFKKQTELCHSRRYPHNPMLMFSKAVQSHHLEILTSLH